MQTKITEIADGIYRLSTFVPDIAPPAGITFNQFLVLGDEPLMFHAGLRKMFPLNRKALSRIIPPRSCDILPANKRLKPGSPTVFIPALAKLCRSDGGSPAGASSS
jgi:hypothetical protein